MKQPAEKGCLNEGGVIGTSPAGMTVATNHQKRESRSTYLKQAIQWEISLKDYALGTKSGL